MSTLVGFGAGIGFGRRRATPLTILGNASVAAWYRSDMGITIGTGVSAWADQSGSGRHLLQAVAGKQPALVAGATPNGKPVLRFDGISHALKTATFALNQPCQAIISCKFTRQAGQTYILDGFAAAKFAVTHRVTAPYNPLLYSGAALFSTAALADAAWQLWDLRLNGADSGIAANGAAYTVGDAGAGNPAGITLGSSASTSIELSILDASELVVVNRVLTAAERAALTAYMRAWSGV